MKTYSIILKAGYKVEIKATRFVDGRIGSKNVFFFYASDADDAEPLETFIPIDEVACIVPESSGSVTAIKFPMR